MKTIGGAKHCENCKRWESFYVTVEMMFDGETEERVTWVCENCNHVTMYTR